VSLSENIHEAKLIFYTPEGKQLKVLPLLSRCEFTVRVNGNELGKGICIYALVVDGRIVDSKRLLTTAGN
jgi:trimeric autotransporter adhesin